jgi:hypothetical protein
VTPDANRRFGLAFGIALPLLQLCRSTCFGNLPDRLLQVPIELDAYVVGALLIAGAWASTRAAWGRTLLAAAWGFACGIMYRTTFEQLADPSRHDGSQALVLWVKAGLFAAAIAGFVGAVLSARPSRVATASAREGKA